MNIYELVVLAFSLSMDSFSAAVIKGMELGNFNIRYLISLSIMFALFQCFMPILGFGLGSLLSDVLISLGHIVSFIILVILGSNLLKKSSIEQERDFDYSFKGIVVLAVAISLDAFSVGITYVNLELNIILSSFLIFFVTLITSIIGILIGLKFGNVLNDKALKLGGLMLIALGIKILIS